MIITREYNEVEYEVEFNFGFGEIGDYFQSPEPHTIDILSIVDEEGNEVDDADVEFYLEQECYDYVDVTEH
tara:strand:- start:1675 stop:1887 length:213 start_codon:yes stop_codon:yes gene_type:complete